MNQWLLKVIGIQRCQTLDSEFSEEEKVEQVIKDNGDIELDQLFQIEPDAKISGYHHEQQVGIVC